MLIKGNMRGFLHSFRAELGTVFGNYARSVNVSIDIIECTTL